MLMLPKIAGTLAGWLMQILGYTLKIRIVDPLNTLVTPKPLIFSFWHGSILPGTIAWTSKNKRPFPLTCLTSASKDGSIIASAMSTFGIQSIRGSSSKRGAAALIALKKAFLAGSDICITPDGPRGPSRQAALGIITLSQITSAPIVPITVITDNVKTLATWDSFQIPFPLSSVTLYIHPPVTTLETLTSTLNSNTFPDNG